MKSKLYRQDNRVETVTMQKMVKVLEQKHSDYTFWGKSTLLTCIIHL